MFESSSGVEQNKGAQLGLAALLLTLTLGFVYFTSYTAPDKNAVNGTYRNECCSDIVISGGRVTQGGQTLDFRLRTMKFGLTGYVYGSFGREQLKKSEELSPLNFETGKSGRRSFTVYL